jgi:hypothetical protein
MILPRIIELKSKNRQELEEGIRLAGAHYAELGIMSAC